MAWPLWILSFLFVVYTTGFVLTLWFNIALGMITQGLPSLTLLRAAVWPIYWATGWPSGRQLRMD